jgi:hypothetical protein
MKLVETHPLLVPTLRVGMQTGVDDGKKSPCMQALICIPTRSVGTRKTLAYGCFLFFVTQ